MSIEYPEIGKKLNGLDGLFTDDQIREARKSVAAKNIKSTGKANLADLRLLAGYSQAEVADKINVHQLNLSLYERKLHRFNPETTKKLSDVLGVTLDQIIVAMDASEIW